MNIDGLTAWWRYLRPKEYLFIISHMRSYSSLLGHILGSHPEVAGYAELHLAYSKHKDLLRLKRKNHQLIEEKPTCRFVLDKILHDYPISERILARKDVQFIFLMRRPEDALRSIRNLGLSRGRDSWYIDQDKVLTYYLGRLNRMVRQAAMAERRPLFIPSEMIHSEPDRTLGFLTQKLGLGDPLSPDYQLFEHSGKPGFGDPSPLIRSGTILEARHDYESIHIEDEILTKACRDHAACFAALAELCDHPDSAHPAPIAMAST